MYTDKDKKTRENPFHLPVPRLPVPWQTGLCVSVCYSCLFWEEPEQLPKWYIPVFCLESRMGDLRPWLPRNRSEKQ